MAPLVPDFEMRLGRMSLANGTCDNEDLVSHITRKLGGRFIVFADCLMTPEYHSAMRCWFQTAQKPGC